MAAKVSSGATVVRAKRGHGNLRNGMRNAKTVAIIAGFGFITLALFVQGLLPALLPESRETNVSRVVRTNLGELKWVNYPAENYTELEQQGRAVYIREGCWYCHSQYIRPVTGEDRRWGPVSQVGEYAFDQPHLFSTRRIGPDLTRVGMLKYSDYWHFAHHWNPRMVVPDSNMPAFPWLYDQVTVDLEEKDGQLAFKDDRPLRRIFTFKEGRQILIMPNTDGLAFARERDGIPTLNVEPLPEPPKRKSLTIVLPTRDAEALVAYIQKLGANRGQWRDVFEPQRIFADQFSIPESQEWVEHGRLVYLRRCVGCHGEKGDGNGPAATFLTPRPRDFRDAVFKFRVTPSGSLPTDGDLFRTITRGVRGTAMPPWHEMQEKERLAVIQFIKTFSQSWKDKNLKAAPIAIPDPPPPSEELIAQGQKLYINEGRCWNCHGGPGMKDDKPFTYPWGLGPSAANLKDDWGFPLLAADFTTGIFKSGPDVTDIFRTMSTGLNGAAMPSFSGNLTEEQRWAISYYVLSLSAYTDPLHRKKLQIPEQAKAALDSPELKTPTWRAAFDPAKAKTVVARPKRKSYLRIAE
jgi:cytochrome c oxidase cbb3-type subunit 2